MFASYNDAETFALDARGYPVGMDVMIQLPGDAHDGARGVVREVFSPRSRVVWVQGKYERHYCVAALAEIP